MQPKITVRPSFTVVGMKYRGPNQHNEIPQLWRKFGPRMDEIKHVVNPEVSYGVMDNYDAATGAFDYLAAMEVDSPADVPADMVAQTIPAQTYAVFPCTLATIGKTYETIFRDWLPNSKYTRAAGPEFEFYGEGFDPDDPTAVMYLYFPVVATD